MAAEDSPRSRPQTRWTAEQLKLLEELAEEKHRQKLARQSDSTQKVTLSWRNIGDRVGGRDAAAAQARYNALVKQRQTERDASAKATSPSIPRETPDRTTVLTLPCKFEPYDDDDRVLEDFLSEVGSSISSFDADYQFSTSSTSASIATSSQDTYALNDKASLATKARNAARNSDDSAWTEPTSRVTIPPCTKDLPERASRELGAAKTAQQLCEQMALEKENNDGKSGSPKRKATAHPVTVSGRPMEPAAQTIEQVAEHQAPVAPMGQQRAQSSQQSSSMDSEQATNFQAVRAKWLAEAEAIRKRREAAQAAEKEEDERIAQLVETIEHIKRVKAAKREADSNDERWRVKRQKREKLDKELAALLAEG